MEMILKYPFMTEKSSRLQASANQYTFVVDINSSKDSIRSAVEKMKPGVEVVSVRTVLMRGKVKRMGKFTGQRSNWKKAIVTLKAGQTLELFEAA